MDSLKGFVDKFRDFLLNEGNLLNLEVGLAPAVYIIIFGVVGILIAFIVAIIVKNLGRASKLKKQLDDATAYVEATGTIDEENVFGLNQRIQEMPETVSRGWGNFLEQQTGYPSDYITKNEVLEERKGNPNYSSGWGSFNFLSILTILLCWGVSALGYANLLFQYPAHLEKIAVVLGYILPVFGTLIVPLIAYLIFYFIFSARQKRAYKKLESSFSAFQDALDNNVIIFREINDEFVEENIEEINAAIEDILANKLGQNDILEIVTTPEIDENLIIEETQDIPLVEEEPWVEEEPITEEDWRGAEPVVEEPVVVEEVEEPVVVEEPQETAEERERRLGERLVQLVFLADQASKDPNITKEEMAELRAFLATTKDSGDYPSDAEQEIFESCLIILDGAYSVRFASEPEEIVEEPQETEAERKEREKGERLVQLVFLADQASRDKEITEKEFVELRSFLATTKDSGDYPSDAEQEIFASCLQILDSAYEVKFPKTPATTPEEKPVVVEEEPVVEEEKPVLEEEPVVEEEVKKKLEVEEPQETEAERIEREKGERLVQLVFLADQASRDKEITEEQFVELRNFLANVKGSGAYPSDVEQEIFGSCLQILDSSFEVKFGKPSPFVKKESTEEPVASKETETQEEIVEEPAVVEESEDSKEEIVEEPAASKETETQEEIVEEPAVAEELEDIQEEIVEEQVEMVAEDLGDVQEEIVAGDAEVESIEDQPEEEVETTNVEEAEEEPKEDKKKKKGLFGRRKK